MAPQTRYTKEEQVRIREYLRALNKPKIQALLDEAKVPRTGNKDQLLERVQNALDEGQLTYEYVVEVLNRAVAWQSQHVYLLDARGGDVSQWRTKKTFSQTLKRHKLGHLLDQDLPIGTADSLSVCQILHDGERLVVVASSNHREETHLKDLNRQEKTGDGRTIEWRAFELHRDRGLVRFEWDLQSDKAMLQITQLESGTNYDKVAQQFKELVAKWLPIDTLFVRVNLSSTIALLREREQKGSREARFSAINLDVAGRHVTGRSSSGKAPFVGAKPVDDAFKEMLDAGVAHLGYVYWQPESESSPLGVEVCTHIHAEAGCVLFSASTSEAVVRHVVERIRILAAEG